MGEKNVLLTGGTGFVGLNIAEQLLKEGWNVVLYARKPLDRRITEELQALPGTLSLELGDVLDQNRMEELLSRYEIRDMIHGAAVTPDEKTEAANPAMIMEVNCMGLLHSLLAAKNHGVRRFLYLGSISAYGRTAFLGKPLVEGVSKGDPYSLYELSKFTGERLLNRLADLYGMEAYVARIGDVYGPWERPTGVRSHMSLIYQATARALKGQSVLLPRECLQDWVSGPDIAGETLALLEAEKLHYRVYPFCGGTRWTLLEWCRLLKERFPDFSYGLAGENEKADIEVNQTKDNDPMSLIRLKEDTGYEPVDKEIGTAFEHYMEWIDGHRFCLEP